MSEDKRAKMTDKVAKLLRQAEDVAGTPEEAVFQAKAFEILAKYGLDMAQINAHKNGLDITELPNAIQWVVNVQGKYQSAQALLLHGMARALHCRTVYRSGGGTYTVFVYGVPHHVERLQFLWELLRPQMVRLVDQVRPADDYHTLRESYNYSTGEWTSKVVRDAGRLKTYRRSWLAGYAQTIESRIREQEALAVESAGGGALVLYKGDEKRAEIAMNENHSNLRNIKNRVRFNSDGYAHGQRDGQHAEFARAVS